MLITKNKKEEKQTNIRVNNVKKRQISKKKEIIVKFICVLTFAIEYIFAQHTQTYAF